VTVRPNPDAPIVGSAPHELRANLNISERGLADPMAAYWALCRLMRLHNGGTEIETEIPWSVEPHPAAPVDDQDQPMESVTISLYYGSEDNGDMAGKIAPLPEFDLPAEKSMWEPRINVEGMGERKADFHVRPRYANMTHVETGNDIPSPFDHDDQPDRGYNVHISGSNLEPDEYLHVLQEACKALAAEVGENWGEDRFGEPLPTSNIIQYERYVRLSRKLSEKLTRQGGAFHSLAMLLSDQAGSKGAFFWDNRDVQGHMSRFLHDSTGAGTMIPGHQHGGQLKSYHPEEVHSDPSNPLYYPKFGALYTGQMNDVTLNDSTASWSERHALGRELEERLVNVLAWSGVPIDPNALGADSEDEYGAFVPDWHFRAEESELEPELADDPTPEIERSQESMIIRSLQRMTDSGLGLTENLIADGGHAHYEELADGAEVSASTVYRWLQRMGDAVKSDNGVITFHSAQLREQFEEIVAGRRPASSTRRQCDASCRYRPRARTPTNARRATRSSLGGRSGTRASWRTATSSTSGPVSRTLSAAARTPSTPATLCRTGSVRGKTRGEAPGSSRRSSASRTSTATSRRAIPTSSSRPPRATLSPTPSRSSPSGASPASTSSTRSPRSSA